MAKISKKQIVSTLRTYDVNKICVLYKNLFGTVPINVRHPYDSESTYACLDGFELYQWAKNFATSEKMERQLFQVLDRAPHHMNWSICDDKYRHAKHGTYAPLYKQRIVNYMLNECKDVKSNYAKRPMMGHTHLYFCSPVYGHRDYNKWRALSIKGNERFCEIVIKYADKFFGPVYDKTGL